MSSNKTALLSGLISFIIVQLIGLIDSSLLNMPVVLLTVVPVTLILSKRSDLVMDILIALGVLMMIGMSISFIRIAIGML